MAEDTKFQIGDVVRLKSGGPVMTVIDESFLGCTWFDDEKHAQTHGFPEKCLILVDSEKMSALVRCRNFHKPKIRTTSLEDYSDFPF